MRQWVIEKHDATEIRPVRHAIRDALGRDAELVAAEAITNAMEHGGGWCLVQLHTNGILILDLGRGVGDGVSAKPRLEGGYGLKLIADCGGTVDSFSDGTIVTWGSLDPVEVVYRKFPIAEIVS